MSRRRSGRREAEVSRKQPEIDRPKIGVQRSPCEVRTEGSRAPQDRKNKIIYNGLYQRNTHNRKQGRVAVPASFSASPTFRTSSGKTIPTAPDS